MQKVDLVFSRKEGDGGGGGESRLTNIIIASKPTGNFNSALELQIAILSIPSFILNVHDCIYTYGANCMNY